MKHDHKNLPWKQNLITFTIELSLSLLPYIQSHSLSSIHYHSHLKFIHIHYQALNTITLTSYSVSLTVKQSPSLIFTIIYNQSLIHYQTFTITLTSYPPPTCVYQSSVYSPSLWQTSLSTCLNVSLSQPPSHPVTSHIYP